MVTVPAAEDGKASIVHSTGAVTKPVYARTRQGKLAEQDHVHGGLIIEVADTKMFHIRQIQADRYGGFFDLDTYYTGDTVTDSQEAAALSLGDDHIPFSHPDATSAWKSIARRTKPKKIYRHDVFNGSSVNHHIIKDPMKRALVTPEVNTLEKELHVLGKRLQDDCKEFPDVEFIIVKSNHDEWLDQYLSKCHFVKDPHNLYISFILGKEMMDGHDPLAWFINKYYPAPNLCFLRRDESSKVVGVQCGAHGDKGLKGQKASPRGLELSHGKSITGHTHSPAIFRENYTNGTCSIWRLGYNQGASDWLHAYTLLHNSGQRQLIISTKSKYCI